MLQISGNIDKVTSNIESDSSDSQSVAERRTFPLKN